MAGTADKNRWVEYKGLLPQDIDKSLPSQEQVSINRLWTRNNVDKILRTPSIPAKKKLDQTMAEFLKDLESSEESNNVEKARKLRIAIMFVSRYVPVDLGKIRVKELPGLAIGEAKDDHIEIDPVLFNNKTYTADQLALVRHALLHELTHLEKKVDNEALTEIFSARFSKDKVRDYENGVNNVMQVIGLLSSDKDAAILEAVELYGAGKYDELYERFKVAYDKKYPQRVSKNPDVALNIFQLAFPELHVDTKGVVVEDKDAIERSFHPENEDEEE